MSDILQASIELGLSALAVGGSVGAAASAARLFWRVAGQWGADLDHRNAALQAQVEIERARAEAEAAKAAALASLQPRSWSYAPHHTATHTPPVSGISPSVVGDMEGTEGDELPGVVDMADLGFRPTTQGILLGLAPGGTPITVSARHLMHTGLIGATGGGKSNTGRLILSQLLHCGVECVIADPHFTTYDAENDDDWAPIAQRLKIAPARKAGEIADLFGWLNDELSRRLDLRSAGERVGKPVVAYVDELPAIVADVPGAMDALGKLLREGRKVALYLVSASQDLLVKTLKSGGEIRENLRSCYYSGGAVASAVPLLDMSRKDITTYERQLGQGVVLLRSHATPEATLARVPLASNEAIRGLLTNDAPTMPRVSTPGAGSGAAGGDDQHAGSTTKPGVEPGSSPLSAQAQRVLECVAEGMSQNEAIRTIWGCEPNSRAGRKAAEEYRAILADIARAVRQ